ncbi:DUF6867 family protein [Novispirillum itersonii]|uniref:Branched-chain amino acid transport system ATP-binding protein n=1 Tax=Novispirillum itersonii TaxID=189 RepID=A0A7W9ZHY1_NOVIT|nr:hypothetical protein [Novispirillum itersonii]MBB6210584.1 branched-chain amino acid transport system ATP-binding protein [Novispirillum itersonii]
MDSLLGSSPLVFVIFTCVMVGWLAYMVGNALAVTWRKMAQVIPYILLLGAANRFFVFALFKGPLLSLSGYLIGTTVLMVIALLSYRMTLTTRIVMQYPWQYERVGLFGWQKKGA